MEVLTKDVIYNKSPQELTSFLYEGVMDHLEAAIVLIDEKNFLEANYKIQKANDIFHRLGVGLKYEAGPIAEQLDTLYNFMANELVVANVKKDSTKIRRILNLVQQISGAWNTVLKQNPATVQPKINKKVAAYESAIMRTTY
ncbi:flagellar export chaperone FliS [Peribacillus saganii]|uniref:Flagellar export chaperone FliS n=1 Tax=Peribacillus saganii TaxID=2303992 RepID=A0A372LPL2_9BACI|nr:flagellar export chaperone FliS [Peribacillus saganii]RFU69338.1 flagellar export chaperone FliS [Peribacillus saganii]